MTNAEYARSNDMFINSCKKVAECLEKDDDKREILAKKFQCTRQASKFRRGTGIVYQTITKR